LLKEHPKTVRLLLWMLIFLFVVLVLLLT